MSENIELTQDDIAEDITENETPAEAPEETQTASEDNPAADNPEIYGAPETYNYQNVKKSDKFNYDDELLNEFNRLNKETNLSQNRADKYLTLALKLAEKNAGKLPDLIKQVRQAKIAQYQAALNTDKEIGANDKTKMNAYLDTADKGYGAFANAEVKNLFAETGLNYHPAVIKMFHRIGELIGDDKIFNAKNPAGQTSDAAEILYGRNSAE